jgi:uncharacterized membrane protein YfcA
MWVFMRVGRFERTPMLPLATQCVLLGSVFAGALVSSFAGFAFSPVAGVALLYFLPHKLVIPLLMFCSIIVQVATLAYLRRSLVWANLRPMLAGGAVGVALAILLFAGIDARAFQVGYGLFLAIYATVMLFRPKKLLAEGDGPVRQTVIGLAGGIVGVLTATPGAIPVVDCDLRGVPKDAQRTTVQPFILAMQVFAISLFAARGDVNMEVLSTLLVVLPALLAGVIVGLLLFGRVPEARFRQVVLVLLFVTGLGLLL